MPSNERMREQKPIITKINGEWRYNCGKFKGERVDLIGNPPHMDYFEWAQRAGAIPVQLLRENPELMRYDRYIAKFRRESREQFAFNQRRRKFRGGDHWFSEELDSDLGDVSGQAAMMEDW